MKILRWIMQTIVYLPSIFLNHTFSHDHLIFILLRSFFLPRYKHIKDV